MAGAVVELENGEKHHYSNLKSAAFRPGRSGRTTNQAILHSLDGTRIVVEDVISLMKTDDNWLANNQTQQLFGFKN